VTPSSVAFDDKRDDRPGAAISFAVVYSDGGREYPRTTDVGGLVIHHINS
jgi:hypothetical protein